MPADRAAAIRRFWSCVTHHAADLAGVQTADDPVYEAVHEALQAVHADLYFEFAVVPEGGELIVTAQGERSLFSLARAIVAAAPAVPGWTFVALKPRRTFPQAITWGSVTVRTADVLFRPHRRATGGFDLDLFLPELVEEQREDAHNGILCLMDHGVGEEALAEQIVGTDLLPLPRGAAADDLVALADLPALLDAATRGPQ